MKEKTLALKGLKVVELGTHVVVPTAARIMADCGADVIKIENLEGEEWRFIGKNNGLPVEDSENALFTNRNSNKKFTALDLKTKSGKEAILKFIAEADVFITNVRLKALSKMGLDYESIKKKFPRLIYGHFTGFGYEGPDRDRPGFDMAAFWARSGALADWANRGEFPSKPIGAFGDGAAANFILTGILMALFAREKNGKGSLVSTSLFGSAIWLSSLGIITAQEPYNTPYPASRYKPAVPLSHIYECKDHNFIIMTVLDYERKRDSTLKLLGMDEYINDPRFDTLKHTKENLEEFTRIVNKVFMTKTRDEWAEIFNKNGIVYEKLMHYREIVKDPQALANRYLEEVSFPSGTTIKMPRYPVVFSEYEVKDISPTGSIGRDTKTALAKAGYTDREIQDMVAEKAVVVGKT
ncbi:MAG: CoA transferase [Spirochaetaceae bacterium]|jgi:crotonobetainyl-CoA:carnitine CoA-transferase CaiB-like acyl-CoA transferase|nr:CoA transferase [Spirochaetaceae bacterium]